MTPAELRASLRSGGITLALDGDQLRVSAPKGAMTPALIAALQEHKVALMDLLRREQSGQVWDEGAATLLVGAWLHRSGAGWPDGLSAAEGPGAELWERFEVAVGEAFAAANWEALYRAYEDFRQGFRPIWQAWRKAQRVEVTR